MPNMNVTPAILGHGMAGQAMARAAACLRITHPELGLAPEIWLQRGVPLKAQGLDPANTLLCIANPDGLHADALLQANALGMRAVLCEKPTCTTLEQVQACRAVKVPTATAYVYRHTWGARALRELIAAGQLGEVFAVEGAFRQAPRAGGPRSSWKVDRGLTSPLGVILGLGTHWCDLASYLVGSPVMQVDGDVRRIGGDWVSHAWLRLQFAGGVQAHGLVSQRVHGAASELHITVHGSTGSASWYAQRADEIQVGQGPELRLVRRQQQGLGTGLPPFHGAGWQEGYVEVMKQLLLGKADDLQPALLGLMRLLEGNWSG